jgi:hypothetical protein
MRGDGLKRLLVLAISMSGAASAQGTISGLNASMIGSPPPTPAVTGITSGSPIPAFNLYVSGNFNLATMVAVDWFDGTTTTSLNFANPTPTLITAVVPSALFKTVASPVTITITETENGAPSNSKTFFVNPPLTPVPGPFVATVGKEFFATVLTGGTQPYVIVPGTLPPGFGMLSTPGGVALQGLPQAAGVFTLAPTVTDFWQNKSSPNQILQIVAPTTLTSLVPPSAIAGSGGFTLIVNGNNFVQPSPAQNLAGSVVQWTFGAVTTQLATTFVSVNQLQATVPANLVLPQGQANVTVLQPDGSVSASLPFTLLPPVISSLSPSSIAAGSPQFPLSVNGSQFLSGAVVFFNGAQLATTFVNSGLLTATVPANLVTTGGFVPVMVANPGGTNSNVFNFFVAPTITSLSPPSTAIGSSAFTLTVNGTQFQPTSVVFLNTTGLATTFVNSGQLTAIVPANLVATAGPFPVVVSIVGGFSAPFNFIVNPAITRLSPPSIGTGSGAFLLSVVGAGFEAGAVISFHGVALTTSFSNSTLVTATVPANLVAAPGVFPVIVTNTDGGVSTPVNFTVRPVITSLSPASVLAGSAAFPFTVTGTGFESGAVISFNSVPLTTSFTNSSQLTTTVPANLVAVEGGFPVVVTNPDGGVSVL